MAESDVRVLVLSDRYPPCMTGGYETACANVAERLIARGVPVLVLTSTFEVGDGRIDGHVRRVLHRPQDTPDLMRSGRWEARDVSVIRQAVREFRPSVIYAWSLLQLYGTVHRAMADAGIPVVFNIQDLWLPTQIHHHEELRRAWHDTKGGFPASLVKRLRRKYAARFVPALRTPVSLAAITLRDAVFGSAYRQTEHRDAGFDTAGSVVIHNGVDTTRFAPAHRAPNRRGPLRLLTNGRFVHEKGVHTAIEAMAILKGRGIDDVSLTVAGFPSFPWDYADALRAMVSDRGLTRRVSFAERIDVDDMPGTYRDHDVFVFPSIGPEGFPMSVLEAMASGICVVGTRTGGTAEVLEHERNGLAFHPGNPGELADAVARILADPELARRLAAEGRRRVVQDFDIDRIAEENLTHLRRVAAAWTTR